MDRPALNWKSSFPGKISIINATKRLILCQRGRCVVVEQVRDSGNPCADDMIHAIDDIFRYEMCHRGDDGDELAVMSMECHQQEANNKKGKKKKKKKVAYLVVLSLDVLLLAWS